MLSIDRVGCKEESRRLLRIVVVYRGARWLRGL